MIRAAYIGYMVEQGGPSRPELLELEAGSVKETLIQIWLALFEGEEGDPNLLPDPFIEATDKHDGDVCVTDRDRDILLFVTFHDDDRAAALAEIGLA